MNEPYLIEGAVPQSLANLIRESKGEPATTKYLPAQFYSELRTIINSGRYLIKRASGAIASFNDAVAAPLVGLRVALPWRSEGWQAVEVTRCGKNFYNINSTLRAAGSSYDAASYRTGQLTDGVYYFGGGYGDSLGANIPLYLRGGLQYAISIRDVVGADEYSGGLSVWSGRGLNTQTKVATRVDYLISRAISTIPTSLNDTFTMSDTAQFVVPGLLATYSYGRYKIGSDKIQVELGSIATAYEPYNGDTYTITLPVGFYGGYLDVVTGQLVATHDANGDLLTNQKLYFLPPVNIPVLAGVNNVWSDAGDVTVSYRVEQ